MAVGLAALLLGACRGDGDHRNAANDAAVATSTTATAETTTTTIAEPAVPNLPSFPALPPKPSRSECDKLSVRVRASVSEWVLAAKRVYSSASRSYVDEVIRLGVELRDISRD